MCKRREIQTGLDTFSYYHGLSPKQKRAILKKLKALPNFITVKDDYEDDSYVYVSSYFSVRGVKLCIFRIRGSRWGLYVIVHPSLALGNEDRSALYQATKTSYRKIVKTVDKMLEPVEMPCSVDDMSLYRADVTANIIFDDEGLVEEYIRILKKSALMHHYKLDWFREKEKKAKDCRLANSHSHKQYCKSAAFFIYDKTAQLEMIDRFPNALIGKKVLRLEAQLRRAALEKWFPGKQLGSNWEIINGVCKKAKRILRWYISRIQPSGKYLRYEDAASLISTVKQKKTRERMLYLLRKVSDSKSLTAALDKMCKRYNLSSSKCRTVLKKFRKLGVSPITLQNSSKWGELPPIPI